MKSIFFVLLFLFFAISVNGQPVSNEFGGETKTYTFQFGKEKLGASKTIEFFDKNNKLRKEIRFLSNSYSKERGRYKEEWYYYLSGKVNKIINYYTTDYIKKNNIIKTIHYWDENKTLLKFESTRSKAFSDKEGIYKAITYFNKSKKPTQIEYYFNSKIVLNLGRFKKTVFIDENGRNVKDIDFYTSTYSKKHGYNKVIINYDTFNKIQNKTYENDPLIKYEALSTE